MENFAWTFYKTDGHLRTMSQPSWRVCKVSYMTPIQIGKYDKEVRQSKVYMTLWSIFTLDSPANAEAASLYRDNMKEYVRRVKATVEQSWMDEGEGGVEEPAPPSTVSGGTQPASTA